MKTTLMKDHGYLLDDDGILRGVWLRTLREVELNDALRARLKALIAASGAKEKSRAMFAAVVEGRLDVQTNDPRRGGGVWIVIRDDAHTTIPANRRKWWHFWCLALMVLMSVVIGDVAPVHAQTATAFDHTVAPGRNYDKAEFRLWYPQGAARLKAVVLLTPGSNGDGRAQVDDPVWREFATTHQLALVGVRLTDKPHEQAFIEEYVNVSQGSGQAVLDALTAFADQSKHPELATAPLLLWGMSAGGEFNYEFVNWKPERVVGFVVNKGGIYYTALASAAARRVPGLLFVGGKDLESRTQTITGLFAVNRRAAALWALAEEPSAAHIVGRSRDVALMFFEDILPLRLPASESLEHALIPLRPIAENVGFLGDLKTRSVRQISATDAAGSPAAWLPTLRVAKAWEALVTERPFESR